MQKGSVSAQTIVAVLAGVLIGIVIGWHGRSKFLSSKFRPQALRESSGFHFINPLLLCDANERLEFIEMKPLNDALERLVASEVRAGHINIASIYFRNLTSGDWVMVNETERYNPASLIKVPLLIAYLKLSEGHSSLLGESITVPTGPDPNIGQEIKPEQTITPGRTYPITELLNRMIVYSDNQAALVLYDHLNQNSLRDVYADLGVPFPDPKKKQAFDFMTVNIYGRFFRVLYNGTYLWRSLSDQALRILSQSSFQGGLVAGLPKGITVAHKFGLLTLAKNGVPYGRELHDCGIIYAPFHPYLLCVMTRGTADLKQMEQAIGNISQFVYGVVTR